MLTRRGRFALRTAKQARIASVPGRLTVASRVHAHAHDRAVGKALARDAVTKRLGGAVHLHDPYEWLPFLVTDERVAAADRLAAAAFPFPLIIDPPLR